MHEEKKLGEEILLVDASTLSAAHWKGTTVRDERNPADLMVGSKFPHEDRTAQDVLKELIAIYNAMRTRWEAFQSYQAWARDGKQQSPGMSCIKIGLLGKLILSKRKGLQEVILSLK